MKRRAFTLIELVLVMLIVIILSGVAVVSINNAIRVLRVSNACDKLAVDMRYAQTMAAATAKWYGVSFDTDPLNPSQYRYYRIYTTTGTLDTPAVNPAKLGSDLVVDLSADFDVYISSLSIGGGTKVEFSPLGIPYNDMLGSPITAEGTITVQKDASVRTVRIAPVTGRVYVQ